MKYNITKISLVLGMAAIAVVGTFAWQSSPVYAATPTPVPTVSVPDGYTTPRGIDISLSPTFVTLTTDPGKSVASQFRVTNNNNFKEYLRVKVEKFVAGPDGSSPVLHDLGQGDTFGDWVHFSDAEFVLEANQSKTIKFTIAPSKDANLGYYYGFVVQRLTSNQNGGSKAVLSAAAALPVLLDVRSPNAKRELQVQSFTTGKLFYEYLPTEFDVAVKNTGNVYVAPSGDVFVDSMTHKDVAILPFNEGRGNVLPGSVRTYTVSWDDGFAVRRPKVENGQVVKDEHGNMVYQTDYDFTKANKFRIGKYTAHLLMVYDNGERDVPVEASFSFWIIPWKILLVGGIILIFALFGIKNFLISNVRRVRKLLNG